MFHKIKTIKPLKDFIIEAEFKNGVKKIYDVKPLFKEIPSFKELKKSAGLFERAKVSSGGYGVIWNDKLDLACDEIWENGRPTSKTVKSDVCDFIYDFVKKRKAAKITQQELERRTGIKQAVIARFEAGDTDARLSTVATLSAAIGLNISLKKPL
jgi:hypothetical protein